MPVFQLLSSPQTYRPCPQNMLVDAEFREHWLTTFAEHFNLIVELAAETYGPAGREAALRAQESLNSQLAALRQKPDMLGALDLEVLGILREQALRSHGIPDAFAKMKARENAAMVPLFAQVASELDGHSDFLEALLLAVEGAFAGNIFDMGATATAGMFTDNSPDFFKIRTEVGGKRPWLVDDFDAFARRMTANPAHQKALIFVDNAGSDIVLGMVPLARLLAKRGTRVCLLANSLPSLNDITFQELGPLLRTLGEHDAELKRLLAARRIYAAASGGGTPLIDLRHVSDWCNYEARDADLVIFQGMGRGLESNFDADFTVDAVNMCMIKERIIAERHQGKVFDVVLRFRPPSAAPRP